MTARSPSSGWIQTKMMEPWFEHEVEMEIQNLEVSTFSIAMYYLVEISFTQKPTLNMSCRFSRLSGQGSRAASPVPLAPEPSSSIGDAAGVDLPLWGSPNFQGWGKIAILRGDWGLIGGFLFGWSCSCWIFGTKHWTASYSMMILEISFNESLQRHRGCV